MENLLQACPQVLLITASPWHPLAHRSIIPINLCHYLHMASPYVCVSVQIPVLIRHQLFGIRPASYLTLTRLLLEWPDFQMWFTFWGIGLGETQFSSVPLLWDSSLSLWEPSEWHTAATWTCFWCLSSRTQGCLAVSTENGKHPDIYREMLPAPTQESLNVEFHCAF
jgi:hypothetical protein